MPRGGIAGSYGSFSFSFYQNSILSSTVIMPAYIPNSEEGSFLLTPSPVFIVCRTFLMMVILTGVRWYLVVLTCISLVISGVPSAFWSSLCLLWRDGYLDLLSIFYFLYCLCSLYILEINPLPIASFPNIFSHSVGCTFTLFMVFFACKSF